MRPLLQRRAAARLAAALLTPFMAEVQQKPALAISATTMSGKTRPDTGCILVNEPRIEKIGKAQVASAELVMADGYVATASFETPWFLQLGAAAASASDCAKPHAVDAPRRRCAPTPSMRR